MNLLPKSHSEFAQIGYWNEFFKKRGSDAFEWYGEYLELCDQIHKYTKKTDKILIAGCGNSKMGMDMYDAGYRQITNIDISNVAIRKMWDLNTRKRPELRFIVMDATATTFKDDNFSVIFDKGTLDALFVDDTADTCQTVKRYLDEMSRVLSNGGRFLCITLLQEHILNYLVDYFPKSSFMLRIVNCTAATQGNRERNMINTTDVSITFPVFLVVATKFKSLPVPILEFSFDGDKMHRFTDTKELIEAVSSVQKAALVCNGLARNNISGHNEVMMDLCKPGEITPRYSVYILDSPPSRGWGKYAVFIVPQGREIEWLFSTPQGRKKLQQSALYQRIAIVHLHRDQIYESLTAVKAELSEPIKCFAPAAITEQIPILSIGTNVGKRVTLVSGFSQISGDFRIEDIENDDNKVFRRLIFLNNQFVVQSEALVNTIKLKGNKEKKKIDFGYLACQHHIYMSVGVQMSTMKQSNIEKEVLVIGLGGGGLCSFLHAALPHVRLTAVEIDPIMLEVAEQYFELKQDKRFHVVIDDGLSFLERCKKEYIHFDAILFDVDSKDLSLGMSCPPKRFLDSAVLETVKTLIESNGLFILNLVCRDDSLRKETKLNIQKAFKSICSYKLDEDVNEVIYCSNTDRFNTVENWKKVLNTSGRSLNNALKQSKLVTKDLVNVTEFLKDLHIC